MKTFRQELQKWLDEKKTSVKDKEQLNLINEIRDKVEELEQLEKHTINSAYDRGYSDKNLNKGFVNNYYANTYKLHKFFKFEKN